jgi:hypothetical protein
VAVDAKDVLPKAAHFSTSGLRMMSSTKPSF